MSKEPVFITWSKGEPYEKSKKDENPNFFFDTEYNITTSFSQEGFTRGNNKKDNLNTKMSDRNLVGQIGNNPFLMNNNYLQDIEVQQNFLIPQNSSYNASINNNINY